MTSKIDIVKDEALRKETSIGKTIDAKPKQATTGREIISLYLQGDAVASITYRKICNALEVLPNWEPEAKVQFLEQFLNISDLLDNRCAGLVSNLARLNWQAVPAQILDKFQKLLCDIAVRQVCHMEVIYSSAVNNLIPVVRENEESGKFELALPAEEQEKLYAAAHRIIEQILNCLPMLNMLSKAECRAEKKITADATIFQMDEEERNGLESENEESERLAKLDGAMRDVLCYIAAQHGIETGLGDLKWLHLNDGSNAQELFSILSSLLEDRMLLSVHVRYTSFLWLYLCSIEETYATRILDLLWSVIVRPHVAQVDIAKAQGAAAYLAAFLARAEYLDVKIAMFWMSRIVQWCLQYLDNCGVGSKRWCLQYLDNCGIGSKRVIAGIVRHGTFYALCQAFFIIFSFRYKEIVRLGEMGSVAHWGLARIVHSCLDPLKYVSGPVGQCFAAISRSLQLVYCNHVLPLDSGVNLPFEPMFPFDTYKLKSSVAVVLPLLRRFSPLAEDKSELISALRCSVSKNQEETMDFLDDEDEIM
ncbi:unnamed protein product, partial [Cylicostephanus goldi]